MCLVLGWLGRRGYAVVEPTDKDVIAFCGEMEFVSPVQIWIIQGGWQFVEKNKFLNLKIKKTVSSSNMFLKLIESW